MWPELVPRVRPRIAPRAYWSQCGAPRPTNAGTKYTPPLSLTVAASASTSEELRINPNPSRNHCTTAPPTNTLPSSAYSIEFPTFHATVVTRRLEDLIGFAPMFCNRKHPVPYVFLVRPGEKHLCPKREDC